MNEEKMISEKTGTESRRDFLKLAGKVAVAAPAVSMLLAAGVKPALANSVSAGGTPPTTITNPGRGGVS